MTKIKEAEGDANKKLDIPVKGDGTEYIIDGLFVDQQQVLPGLPPWLQLQLLPLQWTSRL